MKKDKKKYVKPTVKKNKKMVNVTFASGPSIPGTPPSAGLGYSLRLLSRINNKEKAGNQPAFSLCFLAAKDQ